MLTRGHRRLTRCSTAKAFPGNMCQLAFLALTLRRNDATNTGIRKRELASRRPQISVQARTPRVPQVCCGEAEWRALRQSRHARHQRMPVSWGSNANRPPSLSAESAPSPFQFFQILGQLHDSECARGKRRAEIAMFLPSPFNSLSPVGDPQTLHRPHHRHRIPDVTAAGRLDFAMGQLLGDVAIGQFPHLFQNRP